MQRPFPELLRSVLHVPDRLPFRSPPVPSWTDRDSLGCACYPGLPLHSVRTCQRNNRYGTSSEFPGVPARCSFRSPPDDYEFAEFFEFLNSFFPKPLNGCFKNRLWNQQHQAHPRIVSSLLGVFLSIREKIPRLVSDSVKQYERQYCVLSRFWWFLAVPSMFRASFVFSLICYQSFRFCFFLNASAYGCIKGSVVLRHQFFSQSPVIWG